MLQASLDMAELSAFVSSQHAAEAAGSQWMPTVSDHIHAVMENEA